MIDILMENLTKIFHAMSLLGLSWLADCLLSTYRNIGILSESWDKTRFFNSVKRLVVMVVGLVLIVVVVTDFPLFVNETGIEIPAEYIEVFNIITILLAILITATRYAKGAIEAFFDILNYKNLVEENNKVITESRDIEVSEMVQPTTTEDAIEFVDDSYTAPKE